MSSEMFCDNCELEYDPIRYRWLCPHCGYKASCCDGAPAVAPIDAARFLYLMHQEDQPLAEYAECFRCGGPITRYPDGMWEHAIDTTENSDHVPEPAQEPILTEYVVWTDPDWAERPIRVDRRYL